MLEVWGAEGKVHVMLAYAGEPLSEMWNEPSKDILSKQYHTHSEYFKGAMHQTAGLLLHLHQQGLVYCVIYDILIPKVLRDVKPENFCVNKTDPDGKVVITLVDLGSIIPQSVGDPASKATPAYVFNGVWPSDLKTNEFDIFSYGKMWFANLREPAHDHQKV